MSPYQVTKKILKIFEESYKDTVSLLIFLLVFHFGFRFLLLLSILLHWQMVSFSKPNGWMHLLMQYYIAHTDDLVIRFSISIDIPNCRRTLPMNAQNWIRISWKYVGLYSDKLSEYLSGPETDRGGGWGTPPHSGIFLLPSNFV